MEKKIKLSKQLEAASGVIETTLKDDLMFHMVMAKSELALKGLVCALKGLKEEDVRSVRLLNPINYDEYLEHEAIVDVLVEMNNNDVLNIELQVYKDKNWIKRSLLYLCRAYDCIAGEWHGYERLKPTTHIGIMGYDLFPEYPEFYAKYLLTNGENGHVYSTLVGINVLSLNQIRMATAEDKANSLDYWAEVFRAETWEDLKRLAERSAAVAETAELMYKVSADEHNRSILRARRKYQEVHATLLHDKREAEENLAAAEKELSEMKMKLSAAEAEIAELRRQLAERQGT